MQETMTALNTRLRVGELLKERGITPLRFAEMTGLNYRTVLQIVSNRYTKIGLETIDKICEALNVKPADLFEYKPPTT